MAILNCDKFFIEELNRNGIEIDYKTIMSIYRDSRNNPDYILRKRKTKSSAQLLIEAIEMEIKGSEKHDSGR